MITTYGYLAFICLLACLIDDLTLVFGIIAGMAESVVVFIMPALCYLIASRIEAKRIEARMCEQPLLEGEKTVKRPRQVGGGFCA